jgi:hypothetical protein
MCPSDTLDLTLLASLLPGVEMGTSLDSIFNATKTGIISGSDELYG